MKHKLTNFLLAFALLFSSACSDEDWCGGGSTEEYIEIGEITVNESPESRAHDNSDNWIWVANEKIIVSACDKDGKVLASGTYRRNMENTAWIPDSPLARVGVTYKVTTTVPTAEEINSQDDAYNYVLSDYLESTSALLDDKGVLTATLAHQTVDVVAVVTKGAGWESDEAFYEGLSGYTATFYADRDYTVKGLAVAGNDESVDYNDNTDAGLAPGKKTYIFRAHIAAEKLAVAYGGDKTALLYLEDASGMKLPGTYTRPDGVENGKRLKVTLTLNAPSPSAARSAEKDASALKSGVAVVEPWLGRAIPRTLWNGSDVKEVTPVGDTYTINTAAELAWVAQETNMADNPNTFEGKTIQLANDISLGEQPWTPIGTFTGTFDGNGCTISGLKVSVSTNAGLFEAIGTFENLTGIVKNLGVIGSVTSNCTSQYEGYSAGGIAGKNYGTIQNCYTSVTVICNPTNDMCSAGGIAGDNYCKIQNCYTTGAVTNGAGSVGGIAGTNANAYGGATIQNCYATGGIKGNQIGGIAGHTNIGGTIQSCIALNESIISTGDNPQVGRITGYKENYTASLIGNHAAPSIPGAWVDKGGANKNGADLTEDNFTGAGTNKGAFTGWTSSNWDIMTTNNLPWIRYEQDYNIGGQTNIPSAPYLVAPVTTITDQKGLADIASNLSGSYVLGGNITLSGDWTPITSEFTGTLDGCGYVISGLKVSVTDSNAGLFETIGTGGIVKNLGVTDGSVTAIYVSAGSIAGENNGTIQNCYTNVTVTASSTNNAGGIAGINTGTIQNCYTTGAVTSEQGRAGGIAGENRASEDANTATIQYCYATGAIKGYQAGGISGNMSDKGQILNCIALNDSINGNTDGSASVGRILGYKADGTLANNYAALSIPGVWEAYYKGVDKENGADLPSSFGTDVADTGVFAGWKATDWNIETIYIPFLQGFKTANQPVNKMERKPFLVVPVITITDQKGLVAIKDNLAGSYKLGGNITLTGNWTPLGNETKKFTGTLDGCGYTISGLNVSMTASTSTYAGLFGIIDKDGTVKNLGVTGSVTVTTSGAYSYAYVGGIAGESTGKITNCYTNVTVSATSQSFIYAGGIVGYMSAKTAAISNCFATGDCIATGTGTSSAIAGGILGSTLNTGSISYCFATGTIEAKGATSFKYAGGIAGQSGTTMTGCIALNKGITGASGTTNRIAGNHFASTITNCYASPAIPGTWSEIGATKKDGADLTSANFINSNDAFTGWVPNDWRLGDNWHFEDKDFTNLPTLLTNGLDEDIPLAGQTALARESFLMLIKTKAQLIAFRDGVNATPNDYKGKTIVLAADINLGNENWTPIGKAESTSFMGTFDGGGHHISGLTVTLNGSSAQYGGLFGYIGSGGCVKNLGVSGGKVDVTSPEFAYAGGIAAKNIGQIENCYTDITVKVSAIYAHAGGIAGLNGVDSSNRSSISNCYAVGNVASSYYSGGIAGWSVWGSISNCFATGKVDGKNAAGGITTQSSQSVSNCIALNTGGITCTNANGKCRISYENKESYASPLILGTWNNTTTDGTSLAWNNYMTAVGTWPSASWSNTKNSAKLPILKGFGTNQPAALLRWVSFLPVK